MSLIKITPDIEKAKSILHMVATTELMIKTLDIDSLKTLPRNEVIRELISILLLLDGYKAYGEGSNMAQIEYLENNYKKFTKHIMFIDELRGLRNRAAYDGFFVQKD